MIQIYCGDGKGKTSAAIGAAVRAAGHHIPVVFAQFLKDDTSGEIEILRSILGVAVLHAAHNYGFWKSQSEEEQRITVEEGKALLQQVQDTYQRAIRKKADADAQIDCLIVLDEVMAAMHAGILTESEVLDFLQQVGEQTEVILTGRNPADEILEVADYVSEVVPRKHPYNRGIVARTGVEK